MRKFTFLFAFLFVVLGLSAQTNLVQNPSFETWVDGKPSSWVVPANSSHSSAITISQETTIKTEGASSMKLAINDQQNPGFQQVIPIVAGKSYIVSIDCYVVAGDESDTRIWSSFKNATGFYSAANWTTAVAADPNIQKTLQPTAYTTAANGTWVKVSAEFKAPADATDFVFEFRTYKNATVIYDNASLIEAGGTPVSSTPTITPASGNITGPTAVTITAGEGASIYYTTNGSEPTNASTAYTAPFNVSATTTVKAIAYETGKNPSSVATATYTLVTANTVANIAALRAITLPSTEVYKLTGEAVLTLKATSRNAKYIQDATGAILIDDASGKITTNYNLGDGITGITGTLALFQNMLQFTPTADPGAATSTGNTVAPLAVNLADLTADHQAKLVRVPSVSISDISGGTGLFAASKSYDLNGASNPVLRTQYNNLDYIGQAIPTAPQTIVGVVLVYGTTIQLVPRSLADIATGISTPKFESLSVWTSAGKINFGATAGEVVEVYNTMGQKVFNTLAAEGQNEMAVSLRGVAIVKVGNRVGKVIL